MGHLFPYSDGAPWDLFDLERKFLKAAHAFAASDPAIKADRDRARILNSIQEAER